MLKQKYYLKILSKILSQGKLLPDLIVVGLQMQ